MRRSGILTLDRPNQQKEESRLAGRLSLVSEAAEQLNLSTLEQRDIQLLEAKLSRWVAEWRHRERRRREGWQGGARG